MVKQSSFKISNQKERITILSNASFIFKNSCCLVKKRTNSLTHGRLICIIFKSAGNAPHRNYIRRITKEAFALSNLYQKPIDWIFYFKYPNPKITFEEIFKVMIKLFSLSQIL